jgi:hypothetical protein
MDTDNVLLDKHGSEAPACLVPSVNGEGRNRDNPYADSKSSHQGGLSDAFQVYCRILQRLAAALDQLRLKEVQGSMTS